MGKGQAGEVTQLEKGVEDPQWQQWDLRLDKVSESKRGELSGERGSQGACSYTGRAWPGRAVPPDDDQAGREVGPWGRCRGRG